MTEMINCSNATVQSIVKTFTALVVYCGTYSDLRNQPSFTRQDGREETMTKNISLMQVQTCFSGAFVSSTLCQLSRFIIQPIRLEKKKTSTATVIFGQLCKTQSHKTDNNGFIDFVQSSPKNLCLCNVITHA